MSKIRSIDYVVRVNGEHVETLATLKEARQYVLSRSVTAEVPTLVEIIKVITTQSVVSTFVPQQTLVETKLTEESIDTGIQEA